MAETKHSKMFDKIRRYYDLHVWTANMVRNAVIKGKITEEEYTEITGEEYSEE